MRKLIEKTLYSFGMNSSFYNIAKELEILKENLPPSFKQREVTDIGCGDGYITLKLKKILEPVKISGVDYSKRLIKTARAKSISVKVADIENEEISGDLGVLWGVLHHFNKPEETIKKIKSNFNSLIVREPVDEKRIMELGRRLNKNKVLNVLAKAGVDIGKCKIVDLEETKGLIIFIGL